MPVAAKHRPLFAPAELESEVLDHLAVGVCQLSAILEGELDLGYLEYRIGVYGRSGLLECEQTVQGVWVGIKANRVMLAEHAHDADEADLFVLGIGHTEDISLVHPLPGR